jgi:signal transduction histidine kinase
MSQARLRDRIDEGIDALVFGAAGSSDAESRFLSSLEWVVDQERMTVDDVLAGLLAVFSALDDAMPADVRLSPDVRASERVVYRLLREFASSALGLVTERLEIEADALAESRARLLSVQRVGAAITSSLDLDSTLQTIVTESATLMNGATARLRLADDTGERLRLIAASGELSEDLPGSAVPVETTLAGLCYRSGRPVISNDVSGDPRADPAVTNQFKTRSLLSVPLLVRGEAIGVLTISNLSDRAFEESDAEVLSLFADQAAVAIENAELFEEAQAQITEMEIINRVSSVVSSTLNLGQIYRSIHREIARIMVADAFLIVLGSEENGFDLVYIVDLGQTFSPRHDVDIPPIYRQAMAQRESYIIDTSRHPDFARWERYGDMTKRVQSILVAPLTRGNEAIGLISAQSYAPNSYRRRDRDLLATVANVAAVAIENARLYEQSYGVAVAEERARLAREIHDTIAQGLVGIILQLEAVATQMHDDNPMKRRVERAIDLARVNLDEARRSVRDLRAAPLEHLSLVEALRQLAEQHEDECDTTVSVVAPEAMPLLDRSVEGAIYRFVQEGLSNCRKHAREADVRVELAVSRAVQVSVCDTGPGFDIEAWRRDRQLHRFGLHGMRERAERLGGSLDIDSTPGEGTRLRMEFPLESALTPQ